MARLSPALLLATALLLAGATPALGANAAEWTTAPAEPSPAPRARLGRGLLAALGMGLVVPAALTAAGAGISWAAAGRDEVDLLVGGFAGLQLGVAVAWLAAPWTVDLAMGHGRVALAGALAGLGAGLASALAVYSLAFVLGASAPLLAVAGVLALVGPSLGVVVALGWLQPEAPGAPALALRF
jgi:hypothetical protein